MAAQVSSNAEKIQEWQRTIETGDSELREYHAEMIEYTKRSSERIVKAMTKVTATAIDSEESLIFNDIQQHSSLVFYMQNRAKLQQKIKDAKNERLQMERIQQAVLRDLDFLRSTKPLDNVHLASHTLTLDNGTSPA